MLGKVQNVASTRKARVWLQVCADLQEMVPSSPLSTVDEYFRNDEKCAFDWDVFL